MRSTHGEIEVFLCPDDPTVKAPLTPGYTTTNAAVATTTTATTTTPQTPVPKPSSSNEYLMNNVGDVKVEAVPTTESCMPTDNKTMLSELASAGMRDALLSEMDDFGFIGSGKLQLQTEDQHMSSGKDVFSNLMIFTLWTIRVLDGNSLATP